MHKLLTFIKRTLLDLGDNIAYCNLKKEVYYWKVDRFGAHYAEEVASLTRSNNLRYPGPLSITCRPDVVL